MMTNTPIFVAMLLLISFTAPGQVVRQHQFDISEITLRDTFLLEQVRLLIGEKTTADSSDFARGLGYVQVFVKQFSEGDTLRIYALNSQYHSLDRDIDRLWPQLYAYVDGRLVFIHLPVLGELNNYHYSDKSKRRLKRKLEPFLPEKTAVWWPGPDGKKRRAPDLRMNEKFQMHGGKTIYVFGNKPPQVVYNRY